MNISDREKATAAITLVVLLYGVLGLLAKGRVEAWQIKRDEYRQTCKVLEQERKLILHRPEWEKRYNAVRDLMPVCPVDKPMDIYWQGEMGKIASNNKLSIIREEPGAEELEGDVYELPIKCNSWEGSLDALVHFLYDLQAKGVMMDVRDMWVQQNPNDRSRLKGSFVLYCAYMREKQAAAEPATAAKAATANRKPEVVPRPPVIGTSKPVVLPPVPAHAKAVKK